MKNVNTFSRVLSDEEIENFGKELEVIRAEIQSKVGQEDADYIRNVYNVMRYHEIMGRLLIHFSVDPVTFAIGTGMLGISKILNNMEVGHNVLHGQYDFMNDPELNSRTFDWDHSCDSDQWKFYHNYMHHTYTNIVGKDYDFGYGFIRLSEDQKWKPLHLLQSVANVFLCLGFEWGVGSHGPNVKFLETPRKQRTRNTKKELNDVYYKKMERQLFKDYVLFPLLGGIMAPKIMLGNFMANIMRNVWTYAIIFCGHFTEHTETFPVETLQNETKAEWYLRQLKGSSNLEGSRLFYILSGHLSHQIEHHMFPELPANRYEEIAPRLKALCEKYGQYYNNGSFLSQFSSVVKRIIAYSFPDETARKFTKKSPKGAGAKVLKERAA
ncbi:MAG TPA: acyl-CoA desaturase [Leptospiraceae bacterium]|nr:acyl-CoA desaturase [Leptospiraceae bacterium]